MLMPRRNHFIFLKRSTALLGLKSMRIFPFAHNTIFTTMATFSTLLNTPTSQNHQQRQSRAQILDPSLPYNRGVSYLIRPYNFNTVP